MLDPSSSTPRFPGGEYEIAGILGSGGMAVVYRARDMRRPRDVAIKVLRPEVAQIIGTTRFLREIAVTAAFSHPHILPLLDSGELRDAEGRVAPYYVMPLVDGETLHQHVVRVRRMPLHDALRITREILDALQYAHAKGVIHRDIKPANILLSGGHAVVADFGVARPVSLRNSPGETEPGLTLAGDIIGTPTYMSPEQAKGNAVVDARADLFAVGCVMYEMIVGVQPFDTPVRQYTDTRKLHGIFLPTSIRRPDLPPALDEIIAKALKVDPAERFQSATEFLNALERLDERSGLERGALFRSLPPWVRTGAVAGIALASVVAAVTLSVRNRNLKELPAAELSSEKARVAILPLEQMSPDSLLSIVANGFHTDLIDELAQFPALTVISKNGVLPFRGNAASTDSVARVLNVGSVVTGDIRRVGDSVRVTVRLIDGPTGVQRSKADASGSIHDLLGVRSSVIDSVTSFLRTAIGSEIGEVERQVVRSAEAWELRARVKNMSETEQGLSPALPAHERIARFAAIDSMLLRAAKLDERWPAPLVTSGTMLLQRATLEGMMPISPSSPVSQSQLARDLRLLAIDRASEALKRSPNYTDAIYLRGTARLDLWRTATPVAPDSLRAAAEADLRHAVARRRDMARAWNDLSTLLQLTGEYAGSRDAAETALKADAFLISAPAVVGQLLFTSLAIGRTDEARRWCNQGRTQYPHRPQFWGCELTILGWTGNTRADVGTAWRLLEAAEARDTTNMLAFGNASRRLLVAAIAARAGMADSARAISARARSTVSIGPTSANADFGEAYVLTLLGNQDEAINLLRRFLSTNPAFRGAVRKSPWFTQLRSHPEFARLTALQ